MRDLYLPALQHALNVLPHRVEGYGAGEVVARCQMCPDIVRGDRRDDRESADAGLKLSDRVTKYFEGHRVAVSVSHRKRPIVESALILCDAGRTAATRPPRNRKGAVSVPRNQIQ